MPEIEKFRKFWGVLGEKQKAPNMPWMPWY